MNVVGMVIQSSTQCGTDLRIRQMNMRIRQSNRESIHKSIHLGPIDFVFNRLIMVKYMQHEFAMGVCLVESEPRTLCMLGKCTTT
jgi:hypothetical protein